MSFNKHIRHLFIAAIIMLQACSDKAAPATKTETAGNNTIHLSEAQYANAAIATDTIHTQGLKRSIRVNGMIDVPPQNMVSVSLPMGGYLLSSKLLPGMHLNKGEIIATMEDQQYIQLQQDYLTAVARFGYIEKEYLRQQELNLNKTSSDKVFEQARADYQSQKILIRALSEKLKLIGIDPGRLNEGNLSRSIHVYSPINGFVSKVNVNVGRYINPSDVMFELVNPDDIHLNLTIFEKDLDLIRIGSKVKAYTNNDPDKFYLCDVILIGKDVSKEGYVQVHCHFETYSQILIPGMYMNAEVETGASARCVLPESAVLSHEGKTYAFVASSETRTYKMIEVSTGLRENGMVELLNCEGMKGTRFVSNGAYELLMMLKNVETED